MSVNHSLSIWNKRHFQVGGNNFKGRDCVMTIQDVERVMQDRAKWAHGYRNAELESKRRSAVLWLRNCSAKGWICDKLLTKPEKRK